MSTTEPLSVPDSTGYHTHVILEAIPSPKSTQTQTHTQFPRTGMPQRYESEEEEVSEADTPSREEHFFSSTDVESEVSGYESDVNDENVKRWSQMTTKATASASVDDDAFTLRLSMGSRKSGSGSGSGDGSRPTSVYTIKPSRGSNCSGLSPMPLLRAKDEGSITTTTSTHETDSNMRSFYSDTLSSDDDHTPDGHFCTATPVTYFTPHTRPNLVSISSSLARASTTKVSKKTKKQPSPLSRKSSTDSNRSMKKRISQLRLSQTDNKRNSTLIFQVPEYESSPDLPPESRSRPGSGSARSSTVSSYRNRDSTGSAKREKQWPLPEETPGRRMSIQPSRNIQSAPNSIPPPPPPKEYRTSFDKSRIRGPKITGYRTRTNISVPLPNTIGLATSSPSPTAFSHFNSHPNPYRTSYRPPPTPPTATSEPPSYARFRANSSTPEAWGDPFPSPAYPPPFEQPRLSPPVTPASASAYNRSRERTRSISSMTSSSSKFSLPISFDGGSVRSMMGFNRRRVESPTTSTTSTSTSTSSTGYRERSTSSHSNSRFASLASSSKSTSNLTSYLTNTPTSSTSSHFPRVESPLGTGTTTTSNPSPSPNPNQNPPASSTSRRPSMGRRSTGSPTGSQGQGQDAQQPSRSKSTKSTKWLQSTGERLGAIGMLRKKSRSPGVYSRYQ